jgi:glutamyl-tRNA reductase
LIDIAVPRDVEDEVNEIEDVYLYNIDQLQRIADDGVQRREKQIEICRSVISEFLEEKGIEALAEVPNTRQQQSDFPGGSTGRAVTDS